MTQLSQVEGGKLRWKSIWIGLSIAGTLVLFLLALDLMISSIQHLGSETVNKIFEAAQNPFAGLFIGLLSTAILQSSSTTTAMAVALVATGSLQLSSAIPIILGANVGTTITSAIVSLGFINKKKEFKRAVASGSYHCFFNLLTLMIVFPLEYYYGYLTDISSAIGAIFISNENNLNVQTGPSIAFSPLLIFLVDLIPPVILAFLSFVLLFSSILLFRKLISHLLSVHSPEAFSRFFFKNRIKSFIWGIVTTAAIRSSTITTSVVVPIVAKKIVSLKQAAPFIMGANIGTTITAFIAAWANPAVLPDTWSLAVAHFLFNLVGVLFFLPIPTFGRLPLALATGLGKWTGSNRLIGFAFILLTFFVIPFTLIFLNK